MTKKKVSSSMVSVVVVNYNGLKWLDPCFKALTKTRYPSSKLELILVDNHSQDGSVDFMLKNFPQVRVLHHSQNNYCAANNLGIKNSQGEYIALLNNDTKVTPDWLGELVEVILSNPKIGAVGPKILLPNGKIQSAGHMELPNFRWADRGMREPDMGQYNQQKEVDGLSCSAVLFSKKCFESVGLFDEDFQMFLEDVDFFLRAKKQGWKFYYAPQSVVHHAFHGTAKEIDVEAFVERNRLLVLAKHFPEKLPDALLEKEQILFKNETFHQSLKPDRFLEALPLVCKKILDTHEPYVMKKTLPAIMDQIGKIVDYGKDQAVQRLWHEQKRFEAEAANSQKELEKTSAAVGELENKVSEREKEMENLKHKAQSDERKLQETQSQLSRKEQELGVAQKKEEALREQSRLQGEKLQQLQRDREVFDRSLNTHIRELSEFKQALEQAETARVTISQKVAVDHQRLQQAEVERDQLLEKISQLVREREEIQREGKLVQERLAASSQKVAELEEKARQSQQERDHALEKIEQAAREREGIEAEKRRIEEDLTVLRQVAVERDQLLERIGQLAREREEVQREGRLTQERLNQIQQEKNELKVELETKLQEKEEKIRLFERESSAREYRLKALESYLKIQEQSLGEKEDELRKQRQVIQMQSQEITLLEQRLTGAMEGVAKKELEFEDFRGRYHEETINYEREIQKRERESLLKEQQISEMDNLLKRREMELFELGEGAQREIAALGDFIRKQEEQHTRKTEEQAKKITELESNLQDAVRQKGIFENREKQFLTSETFRWVIRPLWRVLDFLKEIKWFALMPKGMEAQKFREDWKRFKQAFLFLGILTLFAVFIVLPVKIKKLLKR